MLHLLRRTLPVLCLATAAACSAANASYTATSIPAPAVDAPLEKTKGLQQIAVVAGGCFWGIQAVFQHTKGVQTAAMTELLEISARRMIYVSCEPKSLARDLNRLTEHGYRITDVQPFDMFPQTDEVETVIKLES